MEPFRTTVSVDFKDPVSILQKSSYSDIIPWDTVIELCLYIDNLNFHIPYILQLESGSKDSIEKLLEEHFRAMGMDMFRYHCDSILHELDMTANEDPDLDKTLVYSVQLLGGWLIQHFLYMVLSVIEISYRSQVGYGCYRINLVPVNKGLLVTNRFTYLFELEITNVPI